LPDAVTIEPATVIEVAILKQLTWHYVILRSSLATQQRGHRTIVRDLFGTYLQATQSKDRRVIPTSHVESLKRMEAAAENAADRRRVRARVVADLIAGLTEEQAIRLHARLTGRAIGSVMDPVVR
jgi:dGTPase